MNTADGSIACRLCSRFSEQRSDKNGKPYFVCDECGTQFFIRGTLGRERLSTLHARSRDAAADAP
jgi:G:T-mismatch repair DNA endonuclease (very short patch repair protein)